MAWRTSRGAVEIILEDRRYMGHVNTSPVLPDILTYCHEGPWNWIDHPTQPMSASAWGRMWALNILPHEA